MPDHLAHRLQREAFADRPDRSAVLHDRILAGISAEQAGPAGRDTFGGLRPAGWIAIQACAAVVLAIVTFAVIREPLPSPRGPLPAPGEPVAEPPRIAAAVSTRAAENPPPFEELIVELRTDVQGMAAALIGMPDWPAGLDIDAALASLAPAPGESP